MFYSEVLRSPLILSVVYNCNYIANYIFQRAIHIWSTFEDLGIQWSMNEMLTK